MRNRQGQKSKKSKTNKKSKKPTTCQKGEKI